MKKEELKKEFEESLKNITVSDNLKEITLNNIYSKNNVYHLPYWIKNCAAIFVVTCLCLSIYVANNKDIFNKKSSDENSINLHTEDYSLQNINNERETSMDSKAMMKAATLDSVKNFSNDINTTNLAPTEHSITRSMPVPNPSDSILDSAIKTEVTEEAFLKDNPDAKRTKNGYMIIKDNIEVFYVLKDGFIYEINT